MASDNDKMSHENDNISSVKEEMSSENDNIPPENDTKSSETDKMSSVKEVMSSENDKISSVKEEMSSENDKISSKTDKKSVKVKISFKKAKMSFKKAKISSVKEKISSENDKTSDDDTECESDDMSKCSCKRNCMEQFTKTEIEDHILSMQDMDKHEKEMFILESMEQSTPTRTRTGIRKRIRYRFMFDGKVVCRPIFCYLYDIGKKSLAFLQEHVNKNGFVPRVHGNRGRKPHHALQYNDIEYCVDFLIRYVESHGQPMTAEPKGQGKEIPILLPAGLTKVIVHREYKKACEEVKRRGAWHRLL